MQSNTGPVAKRFLVHNRHLRKEKGTGAEMFFAIVSICRSTIGQFFSLSLVTVPEVFAKVNSAQFSSPLFSATLETRRKLGRVNYYYY